MEKNLGQVGVREEEWEDGGMDDGHRTAEPRANTGEEEEKNQAPLAGLTMRSCKCLEEK